MPRKGDGPGTRGQKDDSTDLVPEFPSALAQRLVQFIEHPCQGADGPLSGPTPTLAFQVLRIPVDVRKWLPGDAVFDGTLYVPEKLPEDKYEFRVAMLDPRTGQAVIRFAIEGRQDDGWYSMGSLTITRP